MGEQDVQVIETRPRSQGFVSDVAVPVLQNGVVGGGIFLLTLTIGNVSAYGDLSLMFDRQTAIFTIATCLGVVGFSLLCVVRGAWDEVDVLLYRYVEHRNALDVSEMRQDVAVLIQECERLEQEKAQLSQRLLNTKPSKRKQQQRMTETTWNPSDPDPYEGVVDAFVQQYETTGAANIAMNQPPDEDVRLARQLVSHYITHRTFSKHTAQRASGINKRQWNIATQLLEQCGAITLQSRAYVLAVDGIDQVDALIEQVVQERAKMREVGVHTPA